MRKSKNRYFYHILVPLGTPLGQWRDLLAIAKFLFVLIPIHNPDFKAMMLFNVKYLENGTMADQ